jgi:hypothetical protein
MLISRFDAAINIYISNNTVGYRNLRILSKLMPHAEERETEGTKVIQLFRRGHKLFLL